MPRFTEADVKKEAAMLLEQLAGPATMVIEITMPSRGHDGKVELASWGRRHVVATGQTKAELCLALGTVRHTLVLRKERAQQLERE